MMKDTLVIVALGFTSVGIAAVLGFSNDAGVFGAALSCSAYACGVARGTK